MFFSKLEIKNFRSIDNTGIILDFEKDRNLYALILFAQHVLLTEGQDDQIAYSEVLLKKGIDCNARSIVHLKCMKIKKDH